MGTSPLDYHGALSVITVLNPQLLWPDICFPSGCSAEEGRDTFRSMCPQQTIMAGQESEPRNGEMASKTPGTHEDPIWVLLGSLPIRLCLDVPT